MYLGPHHFQTQNRYFEDSLNFVTASLWRDAYGFAGLQFDGDALRNGTLALAHAKGLFEDGLAFDLPGSDTAPEPRDFRQIFSPVADHLTLHLAVPIDSQEGSNTSLEAKDASQSATRYIGVEQPMTDQNTGRDEKPVRIGRKNLLILGESEVTEKFSSLPMVRILRNGSGRFEADPAFIPPCLNLSASAGLTGILKRLIEILDEKSNVFTSEQERRNGVFQAGMSERHVSLYWFLHTLNSSVSALRHFLLTKHTHPQELFREMSRLGGALCTFGLEVHPRTLPVYDHKDLGARFAALDDHIRRHLEIVIPSRAIKIPLAAVDPTFYYGDVRDERCIGPSRWILEISSPIGEADLIAHVRKQLIKTCSQRFIRELSTRAFPGLELNHLQVPPAQIEAHVESQYFAVSRVGPCWEDIARNRKIGVYVPAIIPSPTLTLIVLLDE
jgi:type VI secretion system protein ImpJ